MLVSSDFWRPIEMVFTSEKGMEIKDLEHIVKILKQNDVTEFELNQDGTQIKLSRGGQVVVQSQTVSSHQPIALMPAAVPPPAAASVENGGGHLNGAHSGTKVESPLVGTFYRKPSPDASPFVSEGDVVKKGDTLCIVEAMKLMNEIEAPCSGKVTKVLPSDGAVVEFGEVLFLIDPGN